MPNIRFFDALGPFGFVLSFYDSASLAITSHSTTGAEMTDIHGAKVTFVGSGLTFSGADISGGTLIAITLTSAAGDVLTTVTGLNRSALDLWTTYKAGTLLDVEFALISGNDHIQGSGVGDYMIGLGGRDVMLGGGGGDAFLGGKGNDKMTGGAGADLFAFAKTDGRNHDVITDFHASGPARSHDHLSVAQAAYDSMVTAQVGSDLEITWSWGGHLTLRGVQMADFGLDDFTLG